MSGDPSGSARYARQRVLVGLGSAGQARLQRARVRVGGLDSGAHVCALYLAGAGVGRIEAPPDLGASCRALNPDVEVHPSESAIGYWLDDGDVYLEGAEGSEVDAGAADADAILRRILALS